MPPVSGCILFAVLNLLAPSIPTILHAHMKNKEILLHTRFDSQAMSPSIDILFHPRVN